MTKQAWFLRISGVLLIVASSGMLLVAGGAIYGRVVGVSDPDSERTLLEALRLDSTRRGKILHESGLIAFPVSREEAMIHVVKESQGLEGLFCGDRKRDELQPVMYDAYQYGDFYYSTYPTQYEGIEGAIYEATIARLETGEVESRLSTEFVPPFILDLTVIDRHTPDRLPEGVTALTRAWYDALPAPEVRVIDADACGNGVRSMATIFGGSLALFAAAVVVYVFSKKK
jgi:hypothetical protein